MPNLVSLILIIAEFCVFIQTVGLNRLDRIYTKRIYFVYSLGIFTSYNHFINTRYPFWHFQMVPFLHCSSSEYLVFLSVYSPECLTNAMLDIQQSHLENCRTPARSHSSASLPYAEIKKSQGTCKPEHGRVASYTSPSPLPIITLVGSLQLLCK